jgi:hypothetical protein
VRHLNTAEAATLLRADQGQDPSASQLFGLLDLVGRGLVAVSIPADSGVDDWNGPYLTAGIRPVGELDGPALAGLVQATARLLAQPTLTRVADDGTAWLAVARWSRSPEPVGGDLLGWQRHAVEEPLVRLGLLQQPPRRLLPGRRPAPLRTPAGDTLVSGWLVVPLDTRHGSGWLADPAVAAMDVVDEWLSLVGCPWVGSPEIDVPPRDALSALVAAFRANRPRSLR